MNLPSISSLLIYIEVIENTTILHFNSTLSQEIINLIEIVVSEHEGLSPEIKEVYKILPNKLIIDSITNSINSAVKFGNDLIRGFTIENVALGITQRGLTNHVLNVTQKLIICLQTGSLYQAIEEIKNIDPNNLDTIILNPTRLLTFRNKLEKYLNITISNTWNE